MPTLCHSAQTIFNLHAEGASFLDKYVSSLLVIMKYTVMSPESSEASEIRLIDAPSLTATSEKFQYCKDVRMRMRRVRVFANGGDNKAKGVENGFDRR